MPEILFCHQQVLTLLAKQVTKRSQYNVVSAPVACWLLGLRAPE